MFESHFGFSAPPFQLNPDPTFYFGSKGHSNALAYLQYGAHQAEGFIVVTGEIGAGKTTLVRTLLDGLDSSQVTAAQIASTQLDATGLLQAILTAFGVPPPQGVVSKASLISTLEAFFMTLAIKNKRALLVVDEAQNLSMDAIEELRMLSNFQLRKQALLQSFLVGQPELRAMLESQRLEQLRQRVIASCHLGPLDVEETRRYIEHRLNRVGWVGNPGFDDSAFPKIHQATGGIPRRINLLCNRLMLSAFLENLTHIDEKHVSRIARELRNEVGETTVAMLPAKSSPRAASHSLAAAAPVAELARQSPMPVRHVAPELPVLSPDAPVALHRIVRQELPANRATVLCLADSPASYLKAALLAAALERGDDSDFRAVVVDCKSVRHLGAMENYAEAVDLPSIEIHLDVDVGSPARRTADVALRFEGLLQEYSPVLVVPLGLSDQMLTCGLLAARTGVAVVRPESGVLPPEAPPDWRLNASLLDRLASVVYVPTLLSAHAVKQEGLPADRIHVMGSLTLDGVVAAQSSDVMAQALLAHHGLNPGLVLVTSRVAPGRLTAASLSKLLLMLDRVRGSRQMLWLVCGETQSALRAQGLGTMLSRSGIALASIPMLGARLSILHRASCLITDELDDLVEAAVLLGKKVLLVDPEGEMPPAANSAVGRLPFNATDLGNPLDVLDLKNPEGGAAAEMVRHLTYWVGRTGASAAEQAGAPVVAPVMGSPASGG